MLNEELQNSSYFCSLPVHVQEGILQSGISFECENDLKKFVGDLDSTQN